MKSAQFDMFATLDVTTAPEDQADPTLVIQAPLKEVPELTDEQRLIVEQLTGKLEKAQKKYAELDAKHNTQRAAYLTELRANPERITEAAAALGDGLPAMAGKIFDLSKTIRSLKVEIEAAKSKAHESTDQEEISDVPF